MDGWIIATPPWRADWMGGWLIFPPPHRGGGISDIHPSRQPSRGVWWQPYPPHGCLPTHHPFPMLIPKQGSGWWWWVMMDDDGRAGSAGGAGSSTWPVAISFQMSSHFKKAGELIWAWFCVVVCWSWVNYAWVCWVCSWWCGLMMSISIYIDVDECLCVACFALNLMKYPLREY